MQLHVLILQLRRLVWLRYTPPVRSHGFPGYVAHVLVGFVDFALRTFTRCVPTLFVTHVTRLVCPRRLRCCVSVCTVDVTRYTFVWLRCLRAHVTLHPHFATHRRFTLPVAFTDLPVTGEIVPSRFTFALRFALLVRCCYVVFTLFVDCLGVVYHAFICC